MVTLSVGRLAGRAFAELKRHPKEPLVILWQVRFGSESGAIADMAPVDFANPAAKH
jgi:hypothetical protein